MKNNSSLRTNPGESKSIFFKLWQKETEVNQEYVNLSLPPTAPLSHEQEKHSGSCDNLDK